MRVTSKPVEWDAFEVLTSCVIPAGLTGDHRVLGDGKSIVVRTSPNTDKDKRACHLNWILRGPDGKLDVMSSAEFEKAFDIPAKKPSWPTTGRAPVELYDAVAVRPAGEVIPAEEFRQEYGVTQFNRPEGKACACSCGCGGHERPNTDRSTDDIQARLGAGFTVSAPTLTGGK